MDLKTIGATLAKIGLPLLGMALPIPGGAAIGTALASMIGSTSAAPEDILAKLTESSDALEKAKEFELTNHQTLVQIGANYEIEQAKIDAASISSVNTTMVAEAANAAHENWWQSGWRPFNGYVVALGSLIAVIAACLLFYDGIVNKDAMAISSIPGLATSIALILAVPGSAVGITAWGRSKTQLAQINAAANS